MTFSELDKNSMELAIKQAEDSLSRMDFPVGAVLVIDGQVIGARRNRLHSENNWVSHAEARLIKKYSTDIKDAVKSRNSNITVYTTLEPCLMCLGTCILNRVSRIVYACPDPYGGVANLDPRHLSEWYVRKWPKIEDGLLREESYGLLTEFMKKKNDDTWRKIYSVFDEMHSKW